MKHLYHPTTAFAAFCLIACLCLNVAAAPAPVSVTETGDIYTLTNGIVTAKIAKRSGSLTSLAYQGIETLANGRGSGYWSHTAAGKNVIDAITIDPKTNDGQRGEVSVKGISGGKPMGSGPGGSVVADIEIRYALGRGDSGIYTYSILTHKPEYPVTALGEARFAVKLNDEVFDWMTVDANRNMKMLTAFDWNHGTVMNMKEARLMTTGLYKSQVEHKYDYSANQFDTLAWGWSSSEKHIGLWFVNPTIEYLSGGPTKVELSAHRDATFGTDPNAPAPPTLLNYWRGSHYGGSVCEIAQGESWTKVVGPFLIYCNSGAGHDEMWKDALAKAEQEAKAWPYDWVAGIDYPHQDQRSTVKGQLVLKDPGAPGPVHMTHLLVGLTAPDYPSVGGRGGPTVVDWQMDAKHYEFWVRGDDDGHFEIPNVRPGSYTLHAIADGVLGEFAGANIHIEAGVPLALGAMEWKPVRYGRQLWEIGVPDRSAREFLHGDHFWQWGLYNQYPKDFPNDVNFVIGKSDYHKDWNYCQCPRPDRPAGTPWSVTFDLPEAPHGKAILRLALAATSAKSITIMINDQPAGGTGPLKDNATIRRDGIHGTWVEKDVTFDGAMMKAGTNVLKLTIPSGGVMNGVEYDYVRLELDSGEGR